MNDSKKTRIAHLAGPTATIQNTPPLITSNKARAKHGLPLLKDVDGAPLKHDALRSQRLAAPVKVYVEQFSAHPLESDAAELYGPPDGYMSTDGVFRKERQTPSDKPVYEIELKPEDGLYPLPYMATQADGKAWEDDCTVPGGLKHRQGFFPDGSRSFEEIDRMGIGVEGTASLLSSIATIDFYRGVPPGGYTKGLPAHLRTDKGQDGGQDKGQADIPPEVRGTHYFGYKPYHLGVGPPRQALAKATNDMQALTSGGDYDGVIWTQGSPQVEESSYWFNLLIDTDKPICCNAAQRPQGQLSADGPANIVDSARYIRSRVWADEQGKNRCGVVVIQEQQIFASREVSKADARPGGYVATGGHGGIVGNISHTGRIALTYLPLFKHTYKSELKVTTLPNSVKAVKKSAGGLALVDIAVKDAGGKLLPDAIPVVTISTDGSYSGMATGHDTAPEIDLIASIDHKLGLGLLTGFVIQGLVPYGRSPSHQRMKLMTRAAFSGIPVAMTGRGAPMGFADPTPFQIAATNLTSNKARFLLMACLLKFGSLPPAKDPDNPTQAEVEAARKAVAAYQAVFDTH
jgi:L-asparaginase/Glu-tRNA(Gln) amidotransferase subunit D